MPHEVSRLRKACDHPARRGVRVAGAADAGKDWHSARHLLLLVRALSGLWAGGLGRPTSQARSRLNRIPDDDVRERIIGLALDRPPLSPSELAVRFADTEGYFVWEASVYRLLKAHDLIARRPRMSSRIAPASAPDRSDESVHPVALPQCCLLRKAAWAQNLIHLSKN